MPVYVVVCMIYSREPPLEWNPHQLLRRYFCIQHKSTIGLIKETGGAKLSLIYFQRKQQPPCFLSPISCAWTTLARQELMKMRRLVSHWLNRRQSRSKSRMDFSLAEASFRETQNASHPLFLFLALIFNADSLAFELVLVCKAQILSNQSQGGT